MSVCPSIESLVREQLNNTGRLSAQQELTFQPVAQNPERRDFKESQRHIVASGTSKIAFLITGKDLAELRQKTELFSNAYPDLACPIFAHGASSGEEFLLAEYFDGITAGQALTTPEIGADRVLTALQTVVERYAKETRPSTPALAREELQRLFAHVLEIEYWSPLDRIFFTDIVFPFVEQHLVPSSPYCRVSNGDFTLTNVMIDTHGAVRVVDYEGASLTHFFAEDWLRLTYWNAPEQICQFARQQIADSAPVCLFLWLKQLVFENEVIIPSRAKIDIQHWGGEIRRFIEKRSPALQQSLLWPSAQSATSRRFLRYISDANRNFSRAIELPKLLENENARVLEDNQTLLEQLNGARLRLYQREIKILQMQRSFSWKATAWLRALRRLWIDSKFGKPAAPDIPAPDELRLSIPPLQFSSSDIIPPPSAILHYQIESPISWRGKLNDIKEITGWVFTEVPVTLTKVRARIGGRIYQGEYGLERPEIAEKFLPRAYSGFRILVEFEENDSRIELEASDNGDEWFVFFTEFFACNRGRLTASHSRLDTTRNHYTHWVKTHDTISREHLDRLTRQIERIEGPPLISVIMPVFNTPAQWLTRAVESVCNQVYTKWELCIADDASTAPHVRPLLEKFANDDPRIKITYRAKNGHISAASNSALEIASGEFVAFLDHDDELEPHALYCFADLLSRYSDAEVVYSDEDKIDESGNRFSPHFKPDWNPDLLNSQNYICHLLLYRTATVRAVGGFRVGLEGSQDWDLALRVTEKVKSGQVYHIPRILYHWRAINGSTASKPSAKDYTTPSARVALAEHFARLGQKTSLSQVCGGHWHVSYARPEPAPLVTLIISTRNRRELLTVCVESILAKTNYPNFEILIADNDSNDPELFAFYTKMQATGRVRVVSCPGPFNFSAIQNRAVQHARGTLIGLLNNDLEAMHPEWLDEMVGHAVRPEIGAVGAKLYYPDMSIQHAGVITGLGGIAGHAFKKFSRHDPATASFRPHVVQNVTAVTAACIIIRKSVFEQAGGFNEIDLKIAFNDVDFCLRIQSLGYRNLFTPFAEFIHHESASRGLEDTPEKIARFQGEMLYMKKFWGERLLNDPAYNLNLTLDREDFSYAFPPRVPPLI
jgi:GT2 family glycosyltransferase